MLKCGKKVNKIKPHDRCKRDLTNFPEQSFLEDINIQDWNNENLEGTDNKGCLGRHAPLKYMSKNQLKKQSKPWMSKYILKLISPGKHFLVSIKKIQLMRELNIIINYIEIALLGK